MDLGMGCEPLKRRLEGCHRTRAASISDDPRPRAKAAVHAAMVGGDEQDTIGIPLDQVGGDLVSLLAEGIGEIAFDHDGFIGLRDTLTPDRTCGVVWIAQAEIVGRDGDRKSGSHGPSCAEPLRLGEPKRSFEAVQVGYCVLRLPAPIFPTG